MRWRRGDISEDVEDRRGMPGGRMPGRGIGIGTIVLALVAMYFGVDPSFLLQGGGQPSNVSAPPATRSDNRNDPEVQFVSFVLDDTRDTWREIFQAAGKQYQQPKLVLFTGATQSACGMGQAAMGPFYCPGDRKVYIDLGFYEDLKTRFKAPGDFAQAYVIAHEVGHHVQNLMGISDRVYQQRQRVSETQGNALSVRLELQADCFAGIWAFHANRARQILETGDVEEALTAATAIGDDRLQKQTRGYVTPDSFTHGSSAQRVRWFTRGIKTGDLGQCDTFGAAAL